MIVATVKGDVHDIGKNIVAVVMACNGYEIRDLGVMVEAQRIVDEAAAWGADAICLSGLITPVARRNESTWSRRAERRSLHIPFIIGGATTSDLHTAVKIAPCTAAPVIHSRDASENNTSSLPCWVPTAKSMSPRCRLASNGCATTTCAANGCAI